MKDKLSFRRRRILLSGFGLILCVLMAVTACHKAPVGDELVILHTNDMHTQFKPQPANWVRAEPKPLIGGMVALKYYVDREKARHPNTLILDAGDIMTGSPISNIEVNGAKGGGFIEMLNLIGYRAMTLGNHEFDNGIRNITRFLPLIHFDVLSANLFLKDELLAPRPYQIYRIGDLKIGVIGLMSEALFELAATKYLQDVRVEGVIETARKYIAEIDPWTDLIVLLTHQGADEDSVLAEYIQNADIIVGGHAHTRLVKPLVVNKILILQAGSNTQNLGRLWLKVVDDTIAAYEGGLIPTWVDSVKNPDPDMVALVQKYDHKITQVFGAKIGELKGELDRVRGGESSAGNFLTDVLRQSANADFAVLNSGGIRKDLDAGPITRLDIVEMLPFYNMVTEFTCSGAELMTLIQRNATAGLQDGHGILQVSGLRYRFRAQANGQAQILSAQVNDQPIEPTRTYRGVTVDFILQGQVENYFGFKPQGQVTMGPVLSDVVIDYIVAHKEITPVLDGRISQENN